MPCIGARFAVGTRAGGGLGVGEQSSISVCVQPLTLFQPRTNGSIEEVLEASSRAREECWQRIGSLEPLVLSHLVNPALMGGPRQETCLL